MAIFLKPNKEDRKLIDDTEKNLAAASVFFP